MIEQLTLENGLRVVLQPDARLPLVASHLLYQGGSAADPPGRCGLAHLCEHLALLGPPRGASGAYLRAIEEAGGTANGSTHHDRTSFELFLLSGSLTLGLWVEASRMLRPAVVSRRILDRERGVLLREHQQTGDGADGRHVELLHQLLYGPGERYRRPPAGRPREIRDVRCSEVEEYLNRFYRPNRATLVLVGDFRAAEVVRRIEEAFGRIPAERRVAVEPHPAALGAPEPVTGQRHARIAARVPAARVYLAFKAPGFGQPGWRTAALWARSVALGGSSPLRRRLQGEARLAAQVKAGMAHMRDASTVVIEAAALPGVEPELLEQALAESVSELVEEGPPEEAVRLAAKKAVNEHYSEIEAFDRRAEDLARFASYLGDARRIEAAGESFRAVGAEEVAAFGRKFGRAEARVVLTIAPEERAA